MAEGKMNTFQLALRVLAVALLALLAAGCDKDTTGTYTVRIAGEWFTLETAIDKEKQARGLGGRESIADDGGMIFIFDRDEERNFWMLDCLVDIDILYLDWQGFIVSAYTMKAQPPRRSTETQDDYERRLRDDSYPSRGRCRYVIELRAGRIGELGLRKGQKIDLDLDRLKALAGTADRR